MIRQCEREREKTKLKQAKKDVQNSATKTRKQHTNLATGVLYQTRKSLKRGIKHARNVEQVEMFNNIASYAKQLEFVRESPLGEGKDMSNPKDVTNIQNKKARGVTGYNVYKLKLENETWIIKTEVYKNRAEAIYTLYKKE